MESRMDKYEKDDVQELSRSKRNEKLYKQVYGSYSDLDYLPVSNNVSEIDEKKLKEIVASREQYHKIKKNDVDDVEVEVKNEDNKIYDINELIDKARNSKPKVVKKKDDLQSYNFLKTLESRELLKSDIEEAIEQDNVKEEIEKNNVESSDSGSKTLSLDILSDLKDDTVLTEPITFKTGEIEKENDENDIPIDDDKVNSTDKTFYSGSYKFSDQDFFDDDYDKIAKNSSFIKVVFIVILVSICITGVYFLIDFLSKR